ncbi:MAG: hypothetical protein GXP62_18210 [Oligoflexia bacterium]|nr:hypothetical protein [Oligoflexia bacterium]
MTTSAYRGRIEAYVRALIEDNDVLRRMAEGEEPTEDELHALAEGLVARKA